MSDQGELFGTYTLGETKDADELWTASGFGGPSIAEFFGLSSQYRVTGRQALEQAAALICVDVLSQDISKATLRLRKRVKGGFDIVDPKEHPIARMLALEPNRRHTWVEFIGMMIYHLALASNSYAYILRNRAGDPLEIIPLMPGRVQDRVNPQSREIFYEVNAATEHEAALLGFYYNIIPERDILHIRQRMVDGFYGYSTLLAGGRTLTLGQKLEDYERRLFAEDGLIRGVFSRDKDKGELNDVSYRRIKDQLKKLMSRQRDGEPILLEDGITYKDMAQKAQEAEMVKALDKQIEATCKLWRMPPHKAMHLTAVKYENLATLEMVYVRDTLVPICRLGEERLARALLTPEERLVYSFWFDRDEMSIADATQENARVKMLAERGIISINEAREDQGYNPREGGDAYILPANTVLIDKKGNQIASGAKPTTAAPVENEDGDAENTDDEKAGEDKSFPRLVASRN